MQRTVAQHLIDRLTELGITEFFGVPGDYNFNILDAIEGHQKARWIGNCTELNASYAADGYARVKGVAACVTTFGVGELSAINGVAGCFSEQVPLFNIVGQPSTALKSHHAIIHHSLGTGDYSVYAQAYRSFTVASAVLSAERAAHDIERLIHSALTESRPVYIGVPADVCLQPVQGKAAPIAADKSHPEILDECVAAILQKLQAARNPVILVDGLVARQRCQREMCELIDQSGLPFCSMFMGKAVVDENHPQFAGLYDGRLANAAVRELVEGADYVLGAGILMSDWNTGAFTARLHGSRLINILPNHTRVGHAYYPKVLMRDVLKQLAKRMERRVDVSTPTRSRLKADQSPQNGKITAGYLYPRLEQFMKPKDLIVSDIGTILFGYGLAEAPEGATFLTAALRGAIGWATPAALGAGLAAPGRRLILLTGEGAHQLTVQEIGTMARWGLKPIIFCLNNSGYLIERLLCKDSEARYNDIVSWDYHKLPEVFGCENWFSARVTTRGELDHAMREAESGSRAAYIEIVTEPMEAPPLAQGFHKEVNSLYREGTKSH